MATVEDRPPPSERPVPAGRAGVAAFSGPVEHLAGLLHVITARLALAFEERRALGLLVGEGTLLDRVRAELLVAHASTADETELAPLREEAARRAAAFDARLDVSRDRGVGLPLADAFDAWGLDADDRTVIACLLGAALSPAIARLLALVAGEVTAPTSIETIAAAVHGGEGGVLALDARLAATAPLRAFALVELAGPPELPLLRRPLVLAPRLTALARGELALDEALARDGVVLHAEPRQPPATELLPEAAFHQLRGALASDALAHVTCEIGGGARALACDVAHSLARPALWIPQVSPDTSWQAALAREAMLHRAVLVYAQAAPLLELALPAVVVDPKPPLAPHVHVAIPRLAPARRTEIWLRCLDDTDLAAAATHVRIGADSIARAAEQARRFAAAAGRSAPARDDVMTALWCELGGARPPLPPRHAWDELVVGGDVHDQIRALVSTAREHRQVDGDRPVLAVLSGARGTGKTMIAGLVARELGLDLCDLADPPIAFRAADHGLALLVFDHAERAGDALVDRLERCRGIAIAMTRAPVADLPPALRTLAATTITIPLPDHDHRVTLWAAALRDLPAVARSLSYAALARELPLCGGDIIATARRAATVTDREIDLELLRSLARRSGEP